VRQVHLVFVLRFIGIATQLGLLEAFGAHALMSLFSLVFELCIQSEIELELIRTQTQEPMQRAEVYARAIRTSQNRNRKCIERRKYSEFNPF